MRPRVFPAEDRCARPRNREKPTRFNEAAGIPRGRRAARDIGSVGALASMRPRVFPAEDEMLVSTPTTVEGLQ